MPANIWRRTPSFYNLIGSKCECGQLYFPPTTICKQCQSSNMSEYQFKGSGSIVTFTVIRQPFNDESENEKLSADSPYIIAIIQLEEGPLITAQITDSNHEDIRIGSKVKSVFRKISEEGKDGLIRYGYKFILNS